MDKMNKKRIGLYGGSFNPIHNGHIKVADTVLELGLVDEVWFSVALVNPFKEKEKSNFADFAERADMVRLAIENKKNMSLITIEEKLGAPSKTIKTVTSLESLSGPNYEFHLIFGADTWNTIDKFYDHELIVNNYKIIVVCRPGYTASTKYDKLENVTFVNYDGLKISSTLIRDNVRNGISIHEMVPSHVAKYIYRHRLYIEHPSNEVGYLFELMKHMRLTVSTAESCTGGKVCGTLTSKQGASEYVKGGIVAYCDEIKKKLLGVKNDTLLKHTAVSQETAIEMADGAIERFGTDCAISVTGYASAHPESGKIFVCAMCCKNRRSYIVENIDTHLDDRDLNVAIAIRRGITMLTHLIETYGSSKS